MNLQARRGWMVRLALAAAAFQAAPSWSTPAPRIQQTAYTADCSPSAVTIMTPQGGLLVKWPVGVRCQPADANLPVFPERMVLESGPVISHVRDVKQAEWRWRRPLPDPLAEQIERFQFFSRRIEVQVEVRWRDKPAKLLRMTYGERLAAGCSDLEGLWESAVSTSPGSRWEVAPVPGLFKKTGSTWMRKHVVATGGPQAFVCGGIDDADITRWNGAEIGRTPLNRPGHSWEQVRRYRIPSAPAGSACTLEVQVQNSEGNGGIWRGPCVIGPAAALSSVPDRDGWIRAAVRGRMLYHWCPDRYEQPLSGRFTVSLTSRDRTREEVPENITSGGRFLIPPYLAAIDGAHGWWGVGTLDLPRAEDGLRIEWRNGTMGCPYLLATETSTHAGDWTAGPRLAILVGVSRKDVLSQYRSAIPAVPTSYRSPWWGGPAYCTWGDQEYARRFGTAGDGDLTDSHLNHWLDALQTRKIDAGIIILDAGWWNLSRSAIKHIHASGKHALLWTQPNWAPMSSAEIRSHPEWLIHDREGRLVEFDRHNWIFDYTVRGTQDYIARSVRSYLDADAWNADGIKLDFPYTSAAIWNENADPSWGAGEQYRARVLQWFYWTVKQYRPEALLSAVSANPLFGAVEDYCRLNDDWTGDPQTYRRRAAVALDFGEWVDCDDWNAYESYLGFQATERPVWGNFTLMSALYRGNRENRPIPLSAAWSSRLSAIFALARQAPVLAGERCVYDPESGVARRTGPDGGLVAEALPLSTRRSPLQVLVVAAGSQLLLTSIADGTVFLRTPRTVTAVQVFDHDGKPHPAPFRRKGYGINLQVRDAAGATAWYRIEMRPDQLSHHRAPPSSSAPFRPIKQRFSRPPHVSGSSAALVLTGVRGVP